MERKDVIELLRSEMLPAMGCTEPAASALAGAKAHELLGNAVISKVEIFASRDMIKNAMGVGIPSCDLKGIQVAVALGICGGDTSKGLSILSDITEQRKHEAALIKSELILVKDAPSLYVSVHLGADNGDSSIATISETHDSFSYLEHNGTVIEDRKKQVGELKKPENGCSDCKNMTLKEIMEFVACVSPEDVPFVLEAVRINMEIAKHSIEGNFGLEVGKTTAQDVSEKPHSLAEAFELAASYAAAGSDARMSGSPMPVIINSGSGNQGITVTVPVSVVASFLNAPEETLVKAVCISELVGLVLTARKNRLSALCGAFTAAIGTACAYVFLLGGDADTMDKAVNTMVGNLTGIICDGAKNTCALKIYSCLEAAALSAKLAMKGFAPGRESGIVGSDSLESISSLSRLSSEGMEETDKTIVSIMLDKTC